MADNVKKLGEPIDRTEWGMLPQTVNAYYNPVKNEIVFPAGILQQPFFALTNDIAVNYGAIGGVIGHEMGHGFDDQGSKSDATGACAIGGPMPTVPPSTPSATGWWRSTTATARSTRARPASTAA